MNNNILSFVILTKDRCETLKKSLQYHCETLRNEGLEDVIKIYVIDNGSIDNTLEYLKDLCLIFNNIVVIKNGKNIGFDNSLLVGLNSTKSRYVWCLQDHAQVLMEQLPYIISLLQIPDIEYSYVFAPLRNEKKYISSYDQKLHALLSGNTLNVNIFNRSLLLPFYKKHLNEFESSGLTFYLANIEMVINYGTKRMLMLPNIVTVYQRFLVSPEGDNDRWQKSFSGYIAVTLGYARILNYIIEQKLLTEATLKQHLAVNDNGLRALHSFIRLRKLKSDSKIAVETAQLIANIPTYSNLERYLVIKAVSDSYGTLILLKFFDLFLFAYLKVKLIFIS
jgi:glycosyltransferase involved in cell wall biosynthesis